MDEDLTMLIGPAPDGALLEIGVLAIDGTIRSLCTRCRSARGFASFSTSEAYKMRHTDDEIERAAERFEQLTDQLDPASVDVDHTDDLRQVAVVSE